jgi:hypothetical protein
MISRQDLQQLTDNMLRLSACGGNIYAYPIFHYVPKSRRGAGQALFVKRSPLYVKKHALIKP